jgi:hypothetical protein
VLTGVSAVLDYKTIKRLRIGGFQDTAALLTTGLGVFATHPILDRIPLASPSLAAMGMGMTGGWYFANRIGSAIKKRGFFPSELSVRSSEPPYEPRAGENPQGLLLGYCVDSGKPVFIPYEDLMRHLFCGGQSGVGKTVMGSFLMFQHILNGGGLTFIDGKLDNKTLNEIYSMLVWAGRAHDLLVINPGDANNSNSYAPILYGDPDEVADRILSLIPSTENNPGADHYKQSAKQGVTTLVAALKRAGLAYNFIDLVILLMNQKALSYLENRVPPSEEKINLSLFLDQYRSINKDGVSVIDVKRLKETFGGIGGRLFMFGTGSFGKVMNTYAPEANLFDAIRGNKIVYVMLPTMGKPETASNFGKMVLGDLRTAISWVQALPDEEKPDPPHLIFMDELGSYATASLSRPFEQARSARIILFPAVQTLANLDSVSEEFREMVLGNTWTKIAFKIGTQKTATELADIIGMEMRVQDSISATGGQGQSSKASSGAADTGTTNSSNLSVGERAAEEYKISPDDLKSLDKGEAIITYGGSKVYHVRIPKIDFTPAAKQEIGKARLNHFRPQYVPGVELYKRAEKYLSTAKGGGDE